MRWTAVFPGAGIEMSGHESAFFKAHQDVMTPVLSEVSALSGLDLSVMIEAETLGDLAGVHSQIATFAFGLGVYRVFTGIYGQPELVAGHSLGIYGALVAAGSLTVQEGLNVLVAAHREATQVAPAGARGGMVAVAGLSPAEVDGVLAGLGRLSLLRVITNSVTSSVVAGLLEDASAFASAAISAGAVRVVWIERDVAYHHPRLMHHAVSNLSADLALIDFNPAHIPLVSTIDPSILAQPAELAAYVLANLSSPIDWLATVSFIDAQGIETLVECGPGTTLTRMGRFIDKNVRYLNVRKAVRRGL